MFKLAVVVISYNVAPLLHNCLESVAISAAASEDWLSVDVVVVDNASSDDSVSMLAAHFPAIHLIASAKNLGFTGGNNLALQFLGFADPSVSAYSGAQLASPDFVLLLNPDTLVEDDALGRMAAFLRDNPHAGAVGAHLHYEDGSFQHAAFQFPGLAQVALDLLPLAELPGIRRVLPRLLDSQLNGRYSRALWAGNKPFPVDFVLGAALMVRGEAIHQVGVLDDGYFMYCEEMDWCIRLRESGWPIYALPTAHITHLEAQSSRQVPWETFERLWRSRFRFYQKQHVHYSKMFLLFLRLLVRAGLIVRGLAARHRFAQGQQSGAILERELAAYAAIQQL